MNRDLVLAPLTAMLISRLTMDFDGSVLSTGRFAEGTAVGFNKQKKVTTHFSVRLAKPDRLWICIIGLEMSMTQMGLRILLLSALQSSKAW